MGQTFDIIAILEQREKITKWKSSINKERTHFHSELHFWKLRLKMNRSELRKDHETYREDTPAETVEEYKRYIPWLIRQLEGAEEDLSKLFDLLTAEQTRCNGLIEKAHKKLSQSQIQAGRRDFKYLQVKLLVGKLLEENPTMTLKHAFEIVATEVEMNTEAVKSAYHYKPKQERGVRKIVLTPKSNLPRQ